MSPFFFSFFSPIKEVVPGEEDGISKNKNMQLRCTYSNEIERRECSMRIVLHGTHFPTHIKYVDRSWTSSCEDVCAFGTAKNDRFFAKCQSPNSIVMFVGSVLQLTLQQLVACISSRANTPNYILFGHTSNKNSESSFSGRYFTKNPFDSIRMIFENHEESSSLYVHRSIQNIHRFCITARSDYDLSRN